jgi:hypothetical protein
MKDRIIVYTVETLVKYGDPGDWKRKVRDIRSKIKDAVNADTTMKIIKIESVAKEVK